MKYSKVFIQAIGYELGPNVVTSEELEERVAPAYRALRVEPGQLEAWTGIRERRWFDRGSRLSDNAIKAGRKAFTKSGVKPSDVGLVIYGGVCRENFEPATACRVADGLGIKADFVFDVSNACLGVLQGVLEAANRIELGQIRAGLVVSCESAREINELTIDRLNANPEMGLFKEGIATLTGGSGAVAVLVTDGSFAGDKHRLLGGAMKSAPEHNELCRWGLDGVSAHAGRQSSGHGPQASGNVMTETVLREVMHTDAIAVLKNGIAIACETYKAMKKELGWKTGVVDKVVCHQVGAANNAGFLTAIEEPGSEAKNFTTFEYLGNMGTAALPISAAIAAERDFLAKGDRVAWLGIGSGLNCLMLGLEW